MKSNYGQTEACFRGFPTAAGILATIVYDLWGVCQLSIISEFFEVKIGDHISQDMCSFIEKISYMHVAMYMQSTAPSGSQL